MFLFKLNGCSVMPNDLSYLRPESFDSESFGLPAGFPHLYPHLNILSPVSVFIHIACCSSNATYSESSYG